ncbi:MAG: AmmeMemoRadiSam system protein B [Candidatus Altiarchaeales archaeon]|nr:AmmeMemoRadiSam system protein B [Candidatus Altiarchaeales archaeon]
MFRSPAVAGSFYYYDQGMLREQVESCINPKARKEQVSGIIVPHAGFMYSGKVAGAVYSEIEMPDTFVILGPNHTGFGMDFSLMSSGVWRMPFGDVRIDSILAESIFKQSKTLEIDFTAHQHEHSIEVQLPFMQYFSDRFQIVPIAVRHYPPTEPFLEKCIDVGNAIAEAVKKTKEKVVVVASTDFTHYESQKTANEKDKKALDAILSMDAARLFKEVRELDISMCGYGPVAVTLTACKKLGCGKTKPVKYMTSGDVTGDFQQVVGYGGVSIKK